MQCSRGGNVADIVEIFIADLYSRMVDIGKGNVFNARPPGALYSTEIDWQYETSSLIANRWWK